MSSIITEAAHIHDRPSTPTPLIAALLAVGVLLLGGHTVAAQEARPETPVKPVMGRTSDESEPPVWNSPRTAPAGAPNVILIMTDDIGFGATTTFGGQIPTPTFDALAQTGLRYNQFNTTAICSATRAALLTGRNHHNVQMGNLTNFPSAYDGYTTVIPKSAGTIAETLRQAGYSTAAFGKWHLTPEWEESQIGPYDHWPTGMGFDYYYGFLGADTSQWAPTLVENTKFIEPPHDDPDYFLEKDMANHAVHWLRQQRAIAPDRPFFIYYAPGTGHAPHHAPKEWLEKFRGKFDQGWDVLRQQTFERQKAMGIIPENAELTPRPSFLPAWSSLSAEQKLVYTRLFEAFAAQLSYTDEQIGRLLEELRQSGELENTLIIYIQGDNGGSAEGGRDGLLYEPSFLNQYDEGLDQALKKIDQIGGPLTYNHFPAAWGWATNSPFQYYKQLASHFGGIRNGLVISWSKHIKGGGELRQQFHHVTDIAPTIMEAVGITPPAVLNGVEQQPLDGISMAYSFAKADTPSRRKVQVYEMIQNLGLYWNGWWAGTQPVKAPWDLTKSERMDLDNRIWELYHVAEDFSQARNLAAENPAKLAQMQQLFWAEAGRNKILPLHGVAEGGKGRPTLHGGRSRFVYDAAVTRLPESAVPRTIGRSYQIDADIIVPETDINGVLVAHGGRFGGYSFYLKEGRPVFHYNAIGDRQYRIEASAPLAPGQHKLRAVFQSDALQPGSGGKLILFADGKRVAQGRIEHTMKAWISHSEGFDIGSDSITPVSEDYTIPSSRFTGTLKQLTITLEP
jgi:arylsulfatase A-like enzyme